MTTTTDPKVAIDWRPHIPVGFEGPATTPVEALIRGQSVLFEEDKWVKQAWFQNEHPEVDPEDPFCNDWQVCAAGAVLMVTVGAARKTTRLKWKPRNDVTAQDTVIKDRHDGISDPESYVKVSCPIPKDSQGWGIVWPDDEDTNVPEGWDVYQAALEFLRSGASLTSNRPWIDVPTFNDNNFTDRTSVLKAFSKAIALAAAAEAEAKAVQAVTQSLVTSITHAVAPDPQVVLNA